MTQQYTITLNPLPEGILEIKGSLTWEAFSDFEDKAFSGFTAHIEVPGFRKGHVPADVAKKQIRDDLILEEMAELALKEYYPKIIEQEKIDAIGKPELSITKIGRGSELGFTIKTAVLPVIDLPDYNALAKKSTLSVVEPVTDEDINKVVEDLRQIRAYGHVHTKEDAVAHAHTEPLPVADDAFAQSFGDFKTIDELKAKVRENITREREQGVKDKRRISIMESITTLTSFAIPQIILQSENDKMFSQIEADISRAGMSMDEYLKHTGKTREQIIEEFKPEAEKRARFQLVLNAIARAEKIAPTDEEVEAEAKHMVDQYPGADLNRARAYADMILTNEKTLAMLENQS